MGLMGTEDLTDCFLWLPRCRSIHTCFMRGSIDVAFLDSEGCVVDKQEALAPWRFRVGAREAESVLEMPAGVLGRRGIEVGDRIVWPFD